MRLRICISAAIGVASAAFCYFLLLHFRQGAGDFNWAIHAAQRLLAGQNPYDTPLEQYPLTAAVFALPFVALRPEIGYRWGNTFSRWRAVPGSEFNLSLYITNRGVGLFVRGVRGTPLSATRARLEPRKNELELALDAALDDECPLLRNLRLTTTDPSTWGRAYDWLRQSEAEYLRALASDDPERVAHTKTLRRSGRTLAR